MSKMFDISGQFNSYGVPTWQYSDGVPVALIDPRTGQSATGVPTYASVALLEAAFPAASNTDLVGVVTGVHEHGTNGGSLWKSNGIVYVPLGAPVYTYANALALCNTNAAAYTGTRFTLSDQNNAVHYFDGTNLVPNNGRCKLASSAVRVLFTAPPDTLAAGVVTDCTLVSGTLYDITFAIGHGLTNAAVLGANLVIKTSANGWVAGQRLKLISFTDGGSVVRVDVGADGGPYFGLPEICRVADEMILKALAIPPLHANSGVDLNFELSCSPRVGNKSVFVRFNDLASNAYEANGITTSYGVVCRLGIRNRNSKTSQMATHGGTTSTSAGIQSGGAMVTTAVDTAGPTTLYINGLFTTTANETIGLEYYELWKEG